jgi:hypothetical protein
MGLGINLETEIMTNSEVVDFLINTTCAGALLSDRFQPYPSQVIAMKGKTQVTFDNATQIAAELQNLPRLSVLQEWVRENRLKPQLEAIHPLLYLLLYVCSHSSEEGVMNNANF